MRIQGLTQFDMECTLNIKYVAGQELNALIGRKVFGCNLIKTDSLKDLNFTVDGRTVPFYKCGDKGNPHGILGLDNYSGSVEHAFKIVEKMRENHQNYPFSLVDDRYMGAYSGGKYLCAFGMPFGIYDGSNKDESCPHGADNEALDFWYEPHPLIAAAQTIPMVICLAALKVVEK